MTIYPLPPEELDDNTLKKQIKAVAQTLSNIHYLVSFIKKEHKIFDFAPLLPPKFTHNLYSLWGKLCRANYLKLVDMGMACCGEYFYRFNSTLGKWSYFHAKYFKILQWARDNVPDLPDVVLKADTNPDIPDYLRSPDTWRFKETTFPLVMPKEYITVANLNTETGKLSYLNNDESMIESYRNYYRAKLKKGFCKGHKEGQLTPAKNLGCFDCDIKWTRREKPEWLQS